ncbi:hypothetical protein ACFPYI_04360 [Halomarina salina]|uniref:Uncharacterized protein n=1 Tax=Halomarina salina TaxID=1872699 RepID=A0ABD5RIY4_9EURY|nr:hypothetical protein [Halomarina salina]
MDQRYKDALIIGGMGVATLGTLIIGELSSSGGVNLWEEAGRFDLPIIVAWLFGIGAVIFSILIVTNVYYPNSDYEG